MTLRELSQLYHLKCEIEKDKKRLAELQSKAYAASSPNLSGEGVCSGVGDRVGRYALEVAEIEQIIKSKMDRCVRERLKLEKYIADIPDSLTRRIFTLRFVDGLSWLKVARAIGGSMTSDCARMICNRYIEKAEQK